MNTDSQHRTAIILFEVIIYHLRQPDFRLQESIVEKVLQVKLGLFMWPAAIQTQNSRLCFEYPVSFCPLLTPDSKLPPFPRPEFPMQCAHVYICFLCRALPDAALSLFFSHRAGFTFHPALK